MLFERLILEDVGVYRGRHELDLSPRPGKPVVLVGALNGGGKTTLLESTQVALYGRFAAPVKRRRYEEYLRRLTNRHALESGTGGALELRFYARREGAEQHYRLRRAWKPAGSGIDETLDIWVDDRHEPALAERWIDHVESFLPRGIAPLFLFDGEQIEAFADLETARELLRTAIGALLGLDLLGQLDTDLTVLQRRKRLQKVEGSLKDSVDERLRELEELQDRIGQSETQLSNLQDAVGEAAREAERLDEGFRRQGGEAFEQRGALEHERTRLLAHRDAVLQTMRDAASGEAPLLLVSSLLKDVAAEGEAARTAYERRLVAEVIEKRDRELLAVLASADGPGTLIGTVELWLERDRAERLSHTDSAGVLELDMAVLSKVEELVLSGLPSIRHHVGATLDELESIVAQLDHVDTLLTAVPDADGLAELLDLRQLAGEELGRRRQAAESAEEELERLLRERQRLVAKIDGELEKLAKVQLEQEDVQRVVLHAGKVQNTLLRLRERLVAKHLADIESLVSESLRSLLRKRGLVESVHIDPETYELELRRSDGTIVPPTSLSAGERQLLATALLWGLARAANRPIPVMIDTPLGRLDTKHRRLLVQRYFPHASHQVVLLSTDEEIDEEARGLLKPSIAREYLLEFNDASESSTVREGYFGSEQP